jgi:hypothetical protein
VKRPKDIESLIGKFRIVCPIFFPVLPTPVFSFSRTVQQPEAEYRKVSERIHGNSYRQSSSARFNDFAPSSGDKLACVFTLKLA